MNQNSQLVLGIDVGGTNTDAVLMRGNKILCSHKTHTTPEVTSGIVQAITSIINRSQLKASDISAVMIGTTHFLNAIVQRRELTPVAAIRLCLPATSAVPPFMGWPDDIKALLGNHSFMIGGGYEFNGKEISKLDEAKLVNIAKYLRNNHINSVAITGVFAHVNNGMELRAAEILRHEIPDMSITLSHQIGRLGLLERENAAILNASLSQLAHQHIRAIRTALHSLSVNAPCYLSQNDGTLMSLEHAAQYPILTCASGPTNSMRGATFLTNIKEAVVADIGGTTTDIGIITNHFPRETTTDAYIGDIRTNFPMPDTRSFGLGGGSLISTHPEISVGPDSVGHQLKQHATVFGGNALTLTDLAVAKGHINLGDADAVNHLDQHQVDATFDFIHQLIAEQIDIAKASAQKLPLILVGGGAPLIQHNFANVSETIIPEHADVANAVGAAISKVSGIHEQVYHYSEITREEALKEAKQYAKHQAISANALPTSIEITDIIETPIPYLDGKATRVRVKAIGDLAIF